MFDDLERMRRFHPLPVGVSHGDPRRCRRQPGHQIAKGRLPSRLCQPRQPHLHRGRAAAHATSHSRSNRTEPALDGAGRCDLVAEFSGGHCPRNAPAHCRRHPRHGGGGGGSERSGRWILHVDEGRSSGERGCRFCRIADAHQQASPDHPPAPPAAARFAATSRLLSRFTRSGERGSHQRPSSTR